MLESLRKSLAGKFSRGVTIHRLDAFITELPEIHRLRRKIEVHHAELNVKVGISRLIGKFRKAQVQVRRVKFMTKQVTIRKLKIRKFTKQDIRLHHMASSKIRVWNGYKKMLALPQERTNRLKFIKTRPQVTNGEMILAWYGPIVDGAVIKLALNKQRGTLLVWYNPRSRQFSAKGVYLIRRLGLGSKPEWRWV